MQMSRHNGLEVKDESFGSMLLTGLLSYSPCSRTYLGPAIFLTDYLDHSPEVRAKIRPDRYGE